MFRAGTGGEAATAATSPAPHSHLVAVQIHLNILSGTWGLNVSYVGYCPSDFIMFPQCSSVTMRGSRYVDI